MWTIAPQTGLQVNESYRDPQLRAFEQYLLSNLRQTDVTTDNEGVYLFNVNQAAYIIEGSSSDEEKYCTRRRVNKGMHELTHTLKETPQSKNGETDRHIFSQIKTQTFFVWVLIWVNLFFCPPN
jgi:hypothetical protein